MNEQIKISFNGFPTSQLCDTLDKSITKEHTVERKASMDLTRDVSLFSNPDLIVALGTVALTGIQFIVQTILSACKAKKKYNNTLVTVKDSKGASLQFPAGSSKEDIDTYLSILERLNVHEIELINQQ
jgi:hypothetical protein